MPSVVEGTRSAASSSILTVVILGIDPGSRITGYGLVRTEGNRLHCLDYGGIKLTGGSEASNFPNRLKQIYDQLSLVLDKYSPTAMAVEDIFYAVNVKSVLKLGHTRGVVLLLAAQFDIPLIEYSPTAVKKAVAGYGRADKVQIQSMVCTLLNLKEKPQPHDASDALAVALCHIFSSSRNQQLKKLG